MLGRPITYVGITLEQAEQGMKARGMPDWLVGHLVATAMFFAAGAFSTENTKPIEDLVGRARSRPGNSSRTSSHCLAERDHNQTLHLEALSCELGPAMASPTPSRSRVQQGAA